MSDDDQSLRSAQGARQAEVERLGIERTEALIEDQDLGALKQSARDEEPALLSVRKLPAAFSDHLLHPRGHAVEDRSEPELAADRVGVLQVGGRRRPSPPKEQVEAQGRRK